MKLVATIPIISAFFAGAYATLGKIELFSAVILLFLCSLALYEYLRKYFISIRDCDTVIEKIEEISEMVKNTEDRIKN